jgi:hypothetical protein
VSNPVIAERRLSSPFRTKEAGLSWDQGGENESEKKMSFWEMKTRQSPLKTALQNRSQMEDA